jgi:hypothetical protein
MGTLIANPIQNFTSTYYFGKLRLNQYKKFVKISIFVALQLLCQFMEIHILVNSICLILFTDK